MNVNGPTFAMVLRRERTKLQLTQEQFADLLHTTPARISMWERGHCVPRIEHVMQLANIDTTKEILLARLDANEKISAARLEAFKNDAGIRELVQAEKIADLREALVQHDRREPQRRREFGPFVPVNHVPVTNTTGAAIAVDASTVLPASGPVLGAELG